MPQYSFLARKSFIGAALCLNAYVGSFSPGLHDHGLRLPYLGTTGSLGLFQMAVLWVPPTILPTHMFALSRRDTSLSSLEGTLSVRYSRTYDADAQYCC
jgi:hypothetical protein